MSKVYMCIDLKSFYASVECIERNLDPLDTNLLVADESRTDKTICLAVSPSLKSYGLGGRCRLFEAKQKVKEVNYQRRKNNNYKNFTGKSFIASELNNNKSLELDFIAAVPRMNLYMKYSTKIYNIYLKYIAPEDILVYSIDEVFCDITNYLSFYKLSAEGLVMKIIEDVYKTTGITATAGIGTNMYLAKVAMDITAKRMKPNKFGVRIAYLDEMKYKKELWNHKPLTDFWRVGKGYTKKLEEHGMYTMGDIARMSINNEDFLFKLFGVNAEFLIDHAWGYEPCTIKDAKNYKPLNSSISQGQVLHCPYNFEKAKLIVKEMIDNLVLELVDKRLKTDQIVLTIGYDIENLTNPSIERRYKGEITIDAYGRKVPKHSHGTANIDHKTSSTKTITNEVMKLYDKIVNPILLIRRLNVTACNIVNEENEESTSIIEQIDLFTNYEEISKQKEKSLKDEIEEKKIQKALLNIKKKYGKNSILKAMNYEEGATAKDRNLEVGGHKG
ncbi:MAG: DNA methylase [Mollicutes bacterium]|nr:DNA methylase [Mollicutes bacterium]